MRTRDELLEQAKRRARKYLDRGDLLNAVTSMGSDLEQHPEMRVNDYLLMLGNMRAVNGDVQGVREWVEGFR